MYCAVGLKVYARSSLHQNLIQATCFSKAKEKAASPISPVSGVSIGDAQKASGLLWDESIVPPVEADRPWCIPSLGSIFKGSLWVFLFSRIQWQNQSYRSQWAKWLKNQQSPRQEKMTGREVPMDSGFLSERRRKKHFWTSHPKAPCSGHADSFVCVWLQHCAHFGSEGWNGLIRVKIC